MALTMRRRPMSLRAFIAAPFLMARPVQAK